MLEYFPVIGNVITFFRQVYEELGKVTWPTRAEALRMTLVVIIVSAAVSVFIGGLDFFLTKVLERILEIT